MATRHLRLDPEIDALVQEARRDLVPPAVRPGREANSVPTLSDETRDAIARFLRDGTYRRLADAVALEDPELRSI